MYSLQRLMNNTPSDVVQRSRAVTVVLMGQVKRVYDDGLETIVFRANCRANTEKNYYKILIELYPPSIHEHVYKKPSMQNPVYLSCSCPFYLYYCEYALARVGSAELEKYSNGKPPVVTNQRYVPYLCKHLFAAAPQIVKEAQKIAAAESRKKGGEFKFK